MEEPYDNEYPKDPAFHERFGPRNILDAKATDVDDPTEHPRWGRVGKQTIADGGPLPPHPGMDPAAKTNMEDVDAEIVRRSLDFIDCSVAADTPFFLWHNATRCHVWTHLAPQWEGKSGFGLFADAMMELDWEVGQILDKLDELGIADDTIVLFTSDNGAEVFSWPDGGNHPFRGEKGSTYEGGFRVPMVAKWPGVIEPGTIVNEIMAHEDWLPTLLAAAGQPDAKEGLLAGLEAGDKTFKVHLDGYNFMPYFTGDVAPHPRRGGTRRRLDGSPRPPDYLCTYFELQLFCGAAGNRTRCKNRADLQKRRIRRRETTRNDVKRPAEARKVLMASTCRSALRDRYSDSRARLPLAPSPVCNA